MSGFVNVYNFIPLPEKKKEKYSEEDRHTGVICYQITTKTPLFIPNTSSENAFLLKDENGKAVSKEHKSYDFYAYAELEAGKYYNDVYQRPVIPGSEIRGMVRNIYETLTASCMGVLNEDVLPVKRSSEVFEAGLIKRTEKDTYELWKAEDCIFRESKDFSRKTYVTTRLQEGQKVYFQKINRGRQAKPLIMECVEQRTRECTEEGFLIKGMPDGSIGKKHNAHVFIPQKMVRTLTKEEVKNIELVLESYKEQPEAQKDSYGEYERNFRNFQKGKGEIFFPIYYSIIEGKTREQDLLYMAPASFTKELSKHSVGELAGNMRPCRELQNACPACDLFGMVGKNNTEASGSKLRFTDATVSIQDNEAYYEPITTLEALGGPKLANTEFYLCKPEGADYWTYDYYIKDGKVVPYQAKLRGRKYYWHQYDVKLPKGIEKTNLNKTVRPVKPNIQFIGKLYYENISRKQLEQLIWILDGSSVQEESQEIAYKLGSGKPLGLGSVTCHITEIKERTVARETGTILYNEKTIDKASITYDMLDFEEESKQHFLTMSNLHAMDGKTVSYPMTEEQKGKPKTEGFKWFVENHKFYGYDRKKRELNTNQWIGMPNMRMQSKTMYALPLISAVQELPYRIHAGGNRDSAQSGTQKVEISGFNKNKTAVQFQAGDNSRGSLFFKNIQGIKTPEDLQANFPVGTKLEVRFKGIDSNGYKQYEFIRKL